ncbi:hypothetical protein Esti_005757 [Eimeria stiedai]
MDQHRLLMQRLSRRLQRPCPLYLKAFLLFLLSLVIASTFANSLVSGETLTSLNLVVETGNAIQQHPTWRPPDGTSTVFTLHRRLSETADSLLTSTSTSTPSAPAEASTSTTASATSSGALRKWTSARGTGSTDAAALASHPESNSTSTPGPEDSTTIFSSSVPSSTAPRKADPPALPPYPTGAKPAMWPVDEGVITGLDRISIRMLLDMIGAMRLRDTASFSAVKVTQLSSL